MYFVRMADRIWSQTIVSAAIALLIAFFAIPLRSPVCPACSSYGSDCFQSKEKLLYHCKSGHLFDAESNMINRVRTVNPGKPSDLRYSVTVSSLATPNPNPSLGDPIHLIAAIPTTTLSAPDSPEIETVD